MKFLLLVSILALSAVTINASYSKGVCDWEGSISTAIGKLTPDGQKTVLKVLKDFQFYWGAAVQAVYDHEGDHESKNIARVNATDSAQLAKIFDFIGVGNYSMGAGELRSSCADAKQLEALVGGLKKGNQVIVWKILKHVHNAFEILYKPIFSIAYANNQAASENLKLTEKSENLMGLLKLLGFD